MRAAGAIVETPSSPIRTPIGVPYIILHATPIKDFRLMAHLRLRKTEHAQGSGMGTRQSRCYDSLPNITRLILKDC